MSCPHCGHALELDGEGGWCPECEDYFPNDIIDEESDDTEGCDYVGCSGDPMLCEDCGIGVGSIDKHRKPDSKRRDEA